MRYLVYFSLFLLQLAFISCEKEEIIEDTPKETPYYLGYFEGTVNGQDISIRNKSASWRYIDAGFYEIMSILDLLDNLRNLSKGELKASKNFVAPTGLKEVANAGNKQRNNWIFSKNAKAFSGKIDKLERACEKLGGIKIDKGDVGYIIDIFDYIKVMFIYYDEDSDFEPEIKVLWTDNILKFVHYEITYYMLEYLFEKMLKIIEE